MAGQGESAQDVAARDDAHLRSLGIKPELRRTLGFLSNFAIAFAFISVSTGTFGNYGVGIGLSGPAFYWTWFIVIGGQLLVALVFAELASHYPVAGSVYQWSKRLSHRTLGWFTGWFYFWAQVVTVSAVAVIVAFVDRRSPQLARGHDRRRRIPRYGQPGRLHLDVHVHRARHADHHDADQRLRRPAAVDPEQHRRGDRDPRHVRLRDHPVDLRERPAGKRPDELRGVRGGPEREHPRHLRTRVLHGRLRRVRLRYRRDLRRGDARRQPSGPARRAVVDPHLRPRRSDLHPGRHPGDARHPGLDEGGSRRRLPDRDDDLGCLQQRPDR